MMMMIMTLDYCQHRSLFPHASSSPPFLNLIVLGQGLLPRPPLVVGAVHLLLAVVLLARPTGLALLTIIPCVVPGCCSCRQLALVLESRAARLPEFVLRVDAGLIGAARLFRAVASHGEEEARSWTGQGTMYMV